MKQYNNGRKRYITNFYTIYYYFWLLDNFNKIQTKVITTNMFEKNTRKEAPCSPTPLMTIIETTCGKFYSAKSYHEFFSNISAYQKMKRGKNVNKFRHKKYEIRYRNN